MKYKHTNIFILLYLIVMLMMSTPLINIANKPVILLGLPMLLTWIVGWTILAAVLLIIHYNLDLKAEKANKELK